MKGIATYWLLVSFFLLLLSLHCWTWSRSVCRFCVCLIWNIWTTLLETLTHREDFENNDKHLNGMNKQNQGNKESFHLDMSMLCRITFETSSYKKKYSICHVIKFWKFIPQRHELWFWDRRLALCVKQEAIVPIHLLQDFLTDRFQLHPLTYFSLQALLSSWLHLYLLSCLYSVTASLELACHLHIYAIYLHRLHIQSCLQSSAWQS